MKRVAIVLVVLLSLTIVTGFIIQSGLAKNPKTFDEVITAAGGFVKDDHQLFASGLDYTANVPSEKIVLWVNGLPISNDELQMRLGLNRASGTGPQTMDEVKQILIREKVIQKEAIELGLTPTEDEINNFICQEKEMTKNDSEYKAGVQKIISTWGLTEDEYWNEYERYNAYRILLQDKLGRHVLKSFYGKKEITPNDEQQAKNDWNKFLEEKLLKAEVKTNPKFIQ